MRTGASASFGLGDRSVFAAAAVAWTAVCGGALAQVPSSTGGSEIGQLERPRDRPLEVPDPSRRIDAPPLGLPPGEPSAPESTPLHRQSRLSVRGFRFVGNTVFSDEQLQGLVKSYVGRAIGTAELEEVRLRITRSYVESGYINSGAVVPDQDVSDGIITIRLIEGRLALISVSGRHRYDPEYFRQRFAMAGGPVLNIERLRQRMQVFLQDPHIERINAQLLPGARIGEAELALDVNEAPPFSVGVSLSNARSPAIGGNEGELTLDWRNLFGQGDSTTLRPTTTQGLEGYQISFSMPITAQDTTLSLKYERVRTRVVEPPLDQLDIGARAESAEVMLAHPLVTTPERHVAASVGLASRQTQNLVLGRPSPLMPDEFGGRIKVGLLRLGIDWTERAANRVIAGRLQLNRGIDAFGATVSSQGFPDSRFRTWLGQLQAVSQLSEAGEVVVMRLEAQHANDSLPGSEKYSIGGIDSVRGYRKDQAVRDSGWMASAELRLPIGRYPLIDSPAGRAGAIQGVLFADAGQAWDRGGANADKVRLSSVGIGVRWEPLPHVEVQLLRGIALTDVSTPTTTWQDRGVHFRFSASRAF